MDVTKATIQAVEWWPTLEQANLIKEQIRNGNEELNSLWSKVKEIVECLEATEREQNNASGKEESDALSTSKSLSSATDGATDDDIYSSLAKPLSPAKYSSFIKRKRKGIAGKIPPAKQIDENKKIVSPGFSELKRMFNEIACETLMVDDDGAARSTKAVPATKRVKQQQVKYSWPSRRAQ